MTRDGSTGPRTKTLDDRLRAYIDGDPESRRQQAPTGPVALPPEAGRYGKSNREMLARQLASMKEKNPFEVLGIASGADAEVIHAAFLRQAKIWHPSRFALEPAVSRALATDIFLLVKKAHDTLMDPKKAAAYRARRSDRLDSAPVEKPRKG